MIQHRTFDGILQGCFTSATCQMLALGQARTNSSGRATVCRTDRFSGSGPNFSFARPAVKSTLNGRDAMAYRLDDNHTFIFGMLFLQTHESAVRRIVLFVEDRAAKPTVNEKVDQANEA